VGRQNEPIQHRHLEQHHGETVKVAEATERDCRLRRGHSLVHDFVARVCKLLQNITSPTLTEDRSLGSGELSDHYLRPSAGILYYRWFH